MEQLLQHQQQQHLCSNIVPEGQHAFCFLLSVVSLAFAYNLFCCLNRHVFMLLLMLLLLLLLLLLPLLLLVEGFLCSRGVTAG